jgi:hypothetical protein
MSINHNRIKVADLEKNQPNKILTTNTSGELEFSEINDIKIDSYNALDYTIAGKALDARQGKILKDLVDNINILLTSDNVNLDTVQELVDAIKTVQTSLSTILVNDLTTGGTTKALTAEMGKSLKFIIDQLSNDFLNSGAKLPFTAFVNPTIGNDTTAVLEDATKPFATIDGVFARYTTDQPNLFIRIYLVNSGVYNWSQKIRYISFEMYSEKNVIVDLSGQSAGSVFLSGNVSPQYTMYFNMPLGTLRSVKVGAGCNFGSEDVLAVVNLQSIIWTTNTYGDNCFNCPVSFIALQNLSIRGSFISAPSYCKTSINLSTLTVEYGKLNCPFKISVSKLTVTVGDAPMGSNESWSVGEVVGQLRFSYTHNQNIKINFENSVISNGLFFDQNNGNFTLSGIIKSTSISGQTSGQSGREHSLNLINLTIENLTSNGFTFYGGFNNVKIINCYINQTIGSWLFRSLSRNDAGFFNLGLEKTTFRQTTPSTLIFLDNNLKLNPIKIGGLETNVSAISNIINTPINFDLLSFKDKSKELVVRNKIDIVNRVLDSSTTYVIDGKLVLLTGEYIEVPATGLTMVGYGFNVSGISKNVTGQSIFSSPATVGSGDFITRDIIYNSGAGSVFNLINIAGNNAIEMNDVNFENCTSLGKITGYRQFTGTTNGFYGCLDGIQLSGNWSGFKLTNSNVLAFGGSGTFIKKDINTVFSNTMYLDLNLSFNTGGKLCDFDPTNFVSDELFQINNTLLKIGGVTSESNTASAIPNIGPNNPRCRWTNSLGLTLTAQKFQDLKSATKVWRVSVNDAGTIAAVEVK